MTKPKIWFAWACGLSKKSVEPLYEAAKEAGYDCTFECRGRYDDLVERMKPYTHYVFGVGPDSSWNHARLADTIGINIMHGQYVFGTWRAPIPDHVILTGNAYITDGRETFAKDKQPQYYAPGYIRADILKTYKSQETKDIKCLVALPKLDEHRSMKCLELIEQLEKTYPKQITYRVHPRNSKTKKDLEAMGALIDTSPTFYESLARAKCLLSGPSNCIIEACHHGIPVGLFDLPLILDPDVRPGREEVMQGRYHDLLVKTYSPMATTFEDIPHLCSWIDNPVAKDAKEAQRYWSNVDGNVQPVIDCFLDILANS